MLLTFISYFFPKGKKSQVGDPLALYVQLKILDGFGWIFDFFRFIFFGRVPCLSLLWHYLLTSNVRPFRWLEMCQRECQQGPFGLNVKLNQMKMLRGWENIQWVPPGNKDNLNPIGKGNHQPGRGNKRRAAEERTARTSKSIEVTYFNAQVH